MAFYSLVATTALALFLPQARVETLTFRTAKLALSVSSDQSALPNTASFQTEVAFPALSSLIPGTEHETYFWVRNDSNPVHTLQLAGQFLSGDQAWDTLQHLIEVQIRDMSSQQVGEWMSLHEWTNQTHQFPGDKLNDNQPKRYVFAYRLLENYPLDPDGDGPLQVGSPIGNELMSQETAGVVFEIDGSVQ